MAKPTTAGVAVGDIAPDFDLPDTDARRQSLADAPAQVIVFTCNHCPYALAWHDRLMDVARDYAGQGVRVLAINSNDSQRYPADSFEAMRARTRDADWPMPYLHDESQAVARSYGAKVTPDVFVLDSQRTLRYRGAPDAAYDDPSQGAAWLREALDDVLGGAAVRRSETKPVGCSVKWRG